MLWTFNSSSLSRVIAIWKYKMMFFGKVKIIIQWCYVKENVNELRVSLMKSLIKKTQFSNYALLTKGKYVLAIAQTITRTTLLTCLRHSFFLFLSCIKSLRSRFLSPVPRVWNTFAFYCLFMGVMRSKQTPVFDLFMRVCNQKVTVNVFLLLKETAIHYR